MSEKSEYLHKYARHALMLCFVHIGGKKTPSYFSFPTCPLVTSISGAIVGKICLFFYSLFLFSGAIYFQYEQNRLSRY